MDLTEVTNKNMKFVQTTLRSYLTSHKSTSYHKHSTSDNNSTTPKSSKFCGGSRVLKKTKTLVSQINKNCENIPGGLRKRSADIFLQSKFLQISQNSVNETNFSSDNDSINNDTDVAVTIVNNPISDEDKAHKRRRDRAIFNYENDKDIPLSARSLQRVHSLSFLEKSIVVNALSPDYFGHYSLRTIEKPRSAFHCAFGSISGETVSQLLFSLTTEQFCKKFFLVDCRYPFEYAGGHIKNAVNIYDINDIQPVFYPSDPIKFKEINSKIPIFYCEFSQKRGPSMALELRRQDRVRNEHKYPNIDYKEVYVIDQGYQKFFSEKRHNDLCEPNDYVPMLHVSYMNELKRYRSHLHDHSQAKIRRHPLFQFPSYNAGNSTHIGSNLPIVPELYTFENRQHFKEPGRNCFSESISSSSSLVDSLMYGLDFNSISMEDSKNDLFIVKEKKITNLNA